MNSATFAIGKDGTGGAHLRGEVVPVRTRGTTRSTVTDPVQLTSTISQIVTEIARSASGQGGIVTDTVRYALRGDALVIDQVGPHLAVSAGGSVKTGHTVAAAGLTGQVRCQEVVLRTLKTGIGIALALEASLETEQTAIRLLNSSRKTTSVIAVTSAGNIALETVISTGTANPRRQASRRVHSCVPDITGSGICGISIAAGDRVYVRALDTVAEGKGESIWARETEGGNARIVEHYRTGQARA
jgi:hypothetical protein